jgi:protein gp37
MAENSKIEWTDHTFNPWVGCTNVSPGCDHCYAESWSKRSGLVKWGNNPRRRTSVAYWRAPLKWNEYAPAFGARHGRRQRVFCASLADVFDNQIECGWRDDLFALIKATPAIDWLLLTKRPQNIRKMLPQDWSTNGYHNVWLGTTCEDQDRYDQRWPVLRKIPASVRFISYEPAIGPLRLNRAGEQPDWLISGGESGHGARPMNPQWVRDLLSDCQELGVAPFHKQWGTYKNNPLVVERGLGAKEAERLDKNGKGGGLLDDRLHRNFPDRSKYSTFAA